VSEPIAADRIAFGPPGIGSQELACRSTGIRDA